MSATVLRSSFFKVHFEMTRGLSLTENVSFRDENQKREDGSALVRGEHLQNSRLDYRKSCVPVGSNPSRRSRGLLLNEFRLYDAHHAQENYQIFWAPEILGISLGFRLLKYYPPYKS